jgi:hypothetical protein
MQVGEVVDGIIANVSGQQHAEQSLGETRGTGAHGSPVAGFPGLHSFSKVRRASRSLA